MIFQRNISFVVDLQGTARAPSQGKAVCWYVLLLNLEIHELIMY